jgi:dTDP-4-amino-4,6-dideoxygalactose transaminase
VVATATRGDRCRPDGGAPVNRINVMQPWLGQEEIDAVAQVLRSGWVAQGPRVARFEGAFAQAQQAHHAVATSSCTTALHLALLVAGVGPGDEVVVPSFSFVATANAPVYVGARPLFADVDPITGNVTAQTVGAVLTDRTRAVIAVDQGGVPVDLDDIRSLCDPRGIVVIEDAACAVGTTYKGRPVGAGAEIVAWSFHPRKILTTGEGGMLTTAREDWAARARRLREHAMSVSAVDRHASVLAPAEQYHEVGFNYRMTDLQAAIGLVQLGRLPQIIERRRDLAGRYTAAVTTIPGLRPVADPPWGTSNFQSYWVEVQPEYPLDRDGLLAHLAAADISARRGIMAAHLHPVHSANAHRPLPATEHLTAHTLILPLFHQMTTEQQSRVLGALSSVTARV